jgi:hypothetical protein
MMSLNHWSMRAKTGKAHKENMAVNKENSHAQCTSTAWLQWPHARRAGGNLLLMKRGAQVQVPGTLPAC